MSTLMEDAADLRRRELEARVAKAMADDMGHGDAAKCMAYARAAVRVLEEQVDSVPAAAEVPDGYVLASVSTLLACLSGWAEGIASRQLERHEREALLWCITDVSADWEANPSSAPSGWQHYVSMDKTARGFAIGTFFDHYGKECSIQKSSVVEPDCIWLGLDHHHAEILASKAAAHGVETDQNCGWVPYPIPKAVSVHARMHLSREQVATLLPMLQHFVVHGELPAGSDAAHRVSPCQGHALAGEPDQECSLRESSE